MLNAFRVCFLLFLNPMIAVIVWNTCFCQKIVLEKMKGYLGGPSPNLPLRRKLKMSALVTYLQENHTQANASSAEQSTFVVALIHADFCPSTYLVYFFML